MTLTRSLPSNTFSKTDLQLSALRAVAIIMPITLVFTSLLGGADSDFQTASFATLFCGLAISALTLSSFRAMNKLVLMAAICIAIWGVSGRFGDWYQARTEVFALSAGGVVFVIGRVFGLRSSLLEWVWQIMIWMMLIFCLVAFASYLAIIMDRSSIGAPLQLKYTFISANTAAALFSLSLLLGIGHAFYVLRHRQRSDISRSHRINAVIRKNLPSILLVILAFTCLILTASITGILFGVAAVLLFVSAELAQHIKHRRRRKRLRHRLAIYIPLILAVVFLGFALSVDLLLPHSSTSEGDTFSRLDLLEAYWAIWQNEPLFGHGLGSFNHLNNVTATLDSAALIAGSQAAPNLVLQWLLQQGAVGVALMFTLLAYIHLSIIRALRGLRFHSGTFMRLALCASCLVFAHGMVDYSLEIPSLMWTYAFILGIASGRASMVFADGNGRATHNGK